MRALFTTTLLTLLAPNVTPQALTTANTQQTIVTSINTLRKATGAQQIFELTIDPNLTGLAQILANQCPTTTPNTVSTIQSTPNTIYYNGYYYAQSISTTVQDPGTVVSQWYTEANNYNTNTNQCASGQQCNDWLAMTYAFSTTVGCALSTSCTNDGGFTYVCVYQVPQTSMNAPYTPLTTSSTSTCYCQSCAAAPALGAAPVGICQNAVDSTVQNQIAAAATKAYSTTVQWSTQLGLQAQAFAEQCPSDATLLKSAGLSTVKVTSLSNTNTVANDIVSQFSAQYVGCGVRECDSSAAVPLYVCIYGNEASIATGAVLYNAYQGTAANEYIPSGTKGSTLSTTTTSNSASSSGSSFTGGDIAGTVIGVLAAVALIAGITWYCYRRRTKRTSYGINSENYGDSETYGSESI